MSEDTPEKWTETDYDKAARALIEAERKIARMESSKGGAKFKDAHGPYKPFTDAEWAQAKGHTITAAARKDAYTALNAVQRIPDGYTLVRVQ